MRSESLDEIAALDAESIVVEKWPGLCPGVNYAKPTGHF